jgi:ATP-dependent Clp protease ATP-binding subunit ClpA
VIQTHIKTPLADEVLFGRLKGGGTVRVVVAGEGKDAKLSFVFPDGPVLPRPDKEIVEARRKKKPRAEPEVRARGRKAKEDPQPV